MRLSYTAGPAARADTVDVIGQRPRGLENLTMRLEEDQTSSRLTAPQIGFLLLISAVGAVVRLVGIRSQPLWLDELLAVNFASGSLFQTVTSVPRFDPHPPLFFLQLNLWMLGGRSDLWILLGSVCWSLLAIVSLFFAVRWLVSDRAAFASALVLAVLPESAEYAQYARMYSMLMALTVWVWYFNQRVLYTAARQRWLVGLGLAELAVVYSHGAGLLMIAPVWFDALWAYRCKSRKGLRPWLGVQILVGALSLPVVVLSSLKEVSHTIAPDLADVLRAFGILLLGKGFGGPAVSLLIGLLIVGFLAAAALRLPEVGRLTAAWTLAPPFIVAIVSHLVKPAWIPRTLVFSLPLLGLAFALIGLGVWKSLRKPALRAAWSALAATVVIGLAVLSVVGLLRLQKLTDYRQAASDVRRQIAVDEVIYAPTNSDLWSLTWYLIGPYWGHPSDVHWVDEQWSGRIDRLGPDWSRRLNLLPRAREIEDGGVRTITGPLPFAGLEKMSGVWLVYRPERPPEDELPSPFELRERTDYRGLFVEHWRRAGAR